MIRLTNDPIDPSCILSQVQSARAGAVVLFLGTARELTDGQRTESLDYACYAKMAEKELARLEAEARQRWPLVGCAMAHRLGHVKPGQVSVAIAVSSPHRREAFEAGQWLIDSIKKVVPIWKQEHWADGTSEWVHPGMKSPTEQRAIE